MNAQTRSTALEFDAPREVPSTTGRGRSLRLERDRRQLNWMVAVAFLLLLVPAALGRLSGWRWQPWSPGHSEYQSLVAEAREAAETYVTLAFLGW